MNTSNISDEEQYVTIFNNTDYLFWFLFVIICSIPSWFCFLFDFYHCFKNRKTLIFDNINHHIILVLLVNDFVQLTICQPLALAYFYLGNVKYFPSVTYCMWWILINYVLITQSLIFTMHASIERCFLLFYKQLMLKYKVFTHYIPLLITYIYASCMFVYLIFFFPCEQSFDYTAFECGSPCYVKSQTMGLFDEIVHLLSPIAIIIIFDALILIRVIALKKRASSASSSFYHLWKQNSRMIIQLSAICLVTLLAWIPYDIGILIQIGGNPNFGSSEVFFHFFQITCIPCLSTSFFVMIGLPQEIRQKMFNSIIFLSRRKEKNATSILTKKT